MSDEYIICPWKVDTSYLHDKKLKAAQRQNRIHARKILRGHNLQKIQELFARIRALKNNSVGCNFCKGLPQGARDLKYSHCRLYGLIIDNKADTASCPECKRVLAAWE